MQLVETRLWHGTSLGDFIFLAHGGAGPADPQSAPALQAQEELKHILKKPAGPLPYSKLKNLPSPANETETRALQLASALEASPLFNAGLGASLQADGKARVSASYMESQKVKFSAVVNIQNILHPSLLAYQLQQKEHCILDSEGARMLQLQLNIPRVNLVTKERYRRWLKYQREHEQGKSGTIGCVGLAKGGPLVAVTSTGGVGNEPVGRIGDTPTIAGNYCSQRTAVSCTGRGEQIINIGLAHRVALLADLKDSLIDAVREAMGLAHHNGYSLACIAVHRSIEGTLQWAAGATASSFCWSGMAGDALLGD